MLISWPTDHTVRTTALSYPISGHQSLSQAIRPHQGSLTVPRVWSFAQFGPTGTRVCVGLIDLEVQIMVLDCAWPGPVFKQNPGKGDKQASCSHSPAPPPVACSLRVGGVFCFLGVKRKQCHVRALLGGLRRPQAALPLVIPSLSPSPGLPRGLRPAFSLPEASPSGPPTILRAFSGPPHPSSFWSWD